ncbi:MAG: hypothetical protein CMH57_15195 [Myxococcales bacterium]|nr:hypothetical protein [Myxococcales bacterium]
MERRFPPTARRLKRARREGDALKSDALAGALTLSAVGVTLLVALPPWWDHVVALTTALWALAGLSPPPEVVAEVARGALMEAAAATAPALLGVLAAATCAHLLQVRPLWTTRPLQLNPERLSPSRWAEALRSGGPGLNALSQGIRAAVLVLVSGQHVGTHVPTILRLPTQPMDVIAAQVGELVMGLTVKLGAVALLLGVLDLWMQRHLRLERLAMTRAEVERERQEDAVQPLLKRRRRRGALGEGGLSAIPSARLVVSGSGGVVGLAYEEGEDRAPRVIARGLGRRAKVMLASARRVGTPIAHEPELAAALLGLELGATLPRALFEPTAIAIQRHSPRRAGAAQSE